MTPRQSLGVVWPAALIAVLVLLPFLGKAFTLDDVTFLLQAQHVLRDPLHPTAFEMVFHGDRIRLSDELVSGPVMAYLLVPALLAGGSEVVAHVIQLGALLVGLCAAVCLGSRLGLDRVQLVLSAILIVVSPAILPMTATAMPDVAAMALGTIGIERLISWRHTRRWSTAFFSASTLALAALARPHALLLLGCAGLYLVASWKWQREEGTATRIRSLDFIPLIISAVVLVGINLIMRDPESAKDLAGTTASRMDGTRLWLNLSNFPLQWAVAFPLAFMWPILEGLAFFKRKRVWTGIALGTVLAILGGYIPLLPFISLATAVIIDALGGAFETRDAEGLLLSTWLLIGAAAAPYVHLPAKYLVPSATAMAIMLARQPVVLWRRNAPVLTTLAVGGAILSVLILRADAELGEIGRRGGHLVAEEVRRGEQVWMDGGWGFQWYAMLAGARPIARTPPFPKPGDVVVAGLQARLVRDYRDKTLLHQEIFDEPGGRLFGGRAGFYASGPFPWAWEDTELGRLEVWRIDQPTQQP